MYSYVCRFRDKDKHLVKKETKCVSDLLQVGGFLRVLRFSPSIHHDMAEVLLKVALNTITLAINPNPMCR
jgi:hypothetical protein